MFEVDSRVVNLCFFILLPLAAGFFPVLDIVIRERMTITAALRAKEFWILWCIYALLAFLVVLVLESKKYLEIGVIGFISVLLGFPMILQSKLFTYRDPATGAQTSVGFEYLLSVVNQLIVPGLKQSTEELIASLQEKWLLLQPARLGNISKNYLTARLVDQASQATVVNWVDNLINDTTANPANADRNMRSLFVEVSKAGGARGIDYVMRRAK